MTELLASDRLVHLAALLALGDVVVLSGAGLSTESGIPDYRGPTGAARRSSPMTYQTFTTDPAARRRYWARSHLGWQVIGDARPNRGHRAVTGLQSLGLLRGIITQNVDGLHQAAGATGVLDLHGRLDRTVCLTCGDLAARGELDARLRLVNPHWRARGTAMYADGDADLPDSALADFRTVGCLRCAGTLKPDVVFFGETVPVDRVERSYALVAGAGALLVLGSSLTVMSGYRFVLRAAKLGLPIAIVNQGVTRGDSYALLTVDAPLGRVLPELLARLAP